MATIVKHKQSGKTYVLIGTGYGAYKAMLPGVFGGSLFPQEESAEIPLAAVSDRYGNMVWMLTEELLVVEVDGRPVGDYFQNVSDRPIPHENAEETCPACGFRVAATARECPSCGLTLMMEEQED
ncbi:hypothetical protein ACFQ88_33795 [Paenibacillus sp. NPDC056579]|uniref:zinc ribbon domain-containing protein n=1 Tax=unclassified Paenibacillus TaxID=185978 RepID=UPI001EF7B0BA|nr:zinc ribbon domain-containing protein [Paenibacillus sp. H1-7]ULL13547.1 hypothetical protein DVH26_03210 [Paenibacillus sp. H1-7]